MKSEDFLRCMNHADDELIREAAENPEFSDPGMMLLDGMSDLDPDLIEEAAERPDKGSVVEMPKKKTGRRKVVSISSRFMKAAAVALLIGAASVSAVSLNNRSDTAEQSAPGVTDDIDDSVEEKKNLSDKIEKNADPSKEDKEDGSTAQPGDRASANDEGEDETEKEKTDQVNGNGTTGSGSAGTELSSGKSSAAAGSSGQSQSAYSGQNSAAGRDKSRSAGSSTAGKKSQTPDGTNNTSKSSTEQKNGTEEKPQPVTPTPSKEPEQRKEEGETAYVQASYNGNSYYANDTETQSWEVNGYIGTAEVTDKNSTKTETAQVYSVSGTGEDQVIAVRIGDSDKLYTYVAEKPTEASVSGNSETSSEPEEAESNSESAEAESEESTESAETDAGE